MAEAMIKYGLFLEGWNYEEGDVIRLLREGKKVLPEEFDHNAMEGKLFCPVCHTTLTRRPLVEAYARNRKKAFFAHLPKYKDVECNQRTPSVAGHRFETEELARQAIEDGELVVIAGFLNQVQEARGLAQPYAAGPVEDPEGPDTEVAIARHIGQEFMVPGRNRTVAGICRRLDENLRKYYLLPGSNVPRLLSDALISATTITGEDEEPKLYFGKIKRVFPHVHQTDIEVKNNPKIVDFHVIGRLREVAEKGFHGKSAGQYVLFWGPIVGYGTGYARKFPSWGEYALVPPAYTHLLDELAAAR